MLSALTRSKCSKCEAPPSGKINFQNKIRQPKLIYGTNSEILCCGFSESFSYKLTVASLQDAPCLCLLQMNEHMATNWDQHSTPNNKIPLVRTKKAHAITMPNNILSFTGVHNTRCSTIIQPMRHIAKGERHKNGMSDRI